MCSEGCSGLSGDDAQGAQQLPSQSGPRRLQPAQREATGSVWPVAWCCKIEVPSELGQHRVQAVRKGGGGRPASSEWSHKELKDLVDWLIGLGPGRTEELMHNVRLCLCPSDAFGTCTLRKPAVSPYVTCTY